MENEIKNNINSDDSDLTAKFDKAVESIRVLVEENQFLKGQIFVYEQIVKAYVGK